MQEIHIVGGAHFRTSNIITNFSANLQLSSLKRVRIYMLIFGVFQMYIEKQLSKR